MSNTPALPEGMSEVPLFRTSPMDSSDLPLSSSAPSSARKNRRRVGCGTCLTRCLHSLMSALGIKDIIAEAKDKVEKSRETFDEQADGHSDLTGTRVQISRANADQIPLFSLISKGVGVILWLLLLTKKMAQAFSSGWLESVKWFFFFLMLGLALFGYVMYTAKTETLAEKMAREEYLRCTVCYDTSKVGQPPCASVTTAAFAVWKNKTADFERRITDHLKKHWDDGEAPMIVSFHVGSQACAIAVKTSIMSNTDILYNPREVNATWKWPAATKFETSDYFGGVSIPRVRPEEIVIEHDVYDEATKLFVPTKKTYTALYARYITHGLEVLNGTHHRIYSTRGKDL